jgi:hypothetical protein
MAKTNETAASGGIGFSSLLAILFIGLKLGHVIAWSWWWVLSPLWIPVAIVGAVVLCMLILAGLAAAMK